jgi:retron-type reverse transcriptase
MEGGVVSARTEGTPQGGPLSPLLSNILLTDLDRIRSSGFPPRNAPNSIRRP